MVYKDFLNAARKHKYTCEVICDNLNKTNTNKTEQKYLLLNLYYLSGYIIECIVKYAIYDLVGYDKKEDVKKLNEKGLNYNTHIKYHKFEKYTEHLRRNISGSIPLIYIKKNIDNQVIQLYKEWDADVRYSYDLRNKDEQHYIQFYEYSVEIYKIILNNVRC